MASIEKLNTDNYYCFLNAANLAATLSALLLPAEYLDGVIEPPTAALSGSENGTDAFVIVPGVPVLGVANPDTTAE
jgi:hypothetical protein